MQATLCTAIADFMILSTEAKKRPNPTEYLVLISVLLSPSCFLVGVMTIAVYHSVYSM
jgi:hypothetical protein